MTLLRYCMAALCAASAKALPVALEGAQPAQMLANFEKGRGTHNPHVFEWSEQNDPVMGGQSTGNFSVVQDGENSHALFQGTVRNVSFLHAPGFCRITTVFPHGHLEDASSFLEGGNGAIQLVVRNGMHTLVGSEYTGFKVAVISTKAGRHHGGHAVFGMYKANFDMGEVRKAGLTGWDTVTIPLQKFSSDWSDFTGECKTKDPDGYQHKCCETGSEDVCPDKEGLSHVNGLSVWAEGVEGDFKLLLKSISAVTMKRDNL